MDTLAILILAAGKSTRMNGIKQLLPINNSTLLEHTINNATESKANKVYCVLGANSKTILSQINTENVQFVNNPNYEKGLGSSIKSGVDFIKKNHQNINKILIMLADQPEVDVQILNSIIDLSTHNDKKIIATSYKGRLGVPALFPKIYFQQLLKLSKDFGAKKLINNELKNTIRFKPNKEFIDLDTQEDYKNYLNNLS